MPTKIEVTENLIVDLMFYGLMSNWTSDQLKEKYKLLGIDEDIVNRVLNKGVNYD